MNGVAEKEALPPPEVVDHDVLPKSSPTERGDKLPGRLDGRRWRALRSFLSRIPVASLVAWCMCVVGIIIFCSCLHEAVKFLIQQFNIDVVPKILWLVLLLHIGVASFFFFVALMSTGDTRKQLCTRCVAFNFFGRCCQIVVIVIAYIFHLIWLLLPAVLLLPLAILTALMLACRFLPDCINLSDYGVPPDVIDKIKPADIINTLKNIDEKDLEHYINQGEKILNKAIDAAENSPVLENLLSTIENKMPPPEELEKFVDKIVGQIDINEVLRMIDQIEHGVDKAAVTVNSAIDNIADKVQNGTLGNIPDASQGVQDSHNTTATDQSYPGNGTDTGTTNSTLVSRRKRHSGPLYNPTSLDIYNHYIFPIDMYTFSFDVQYKLREFHCECTERHERSRRQAAAYAADEARTAVNGTNGAEEVADLGDTVLEEASKMKNDSDYLMQNAEQLAKEGAQNLIDGAQETGTAAIQSAQAKAEDLRLKAAEAGKNLTEKVEKEVEKVRQDLLQAAQGLTGDARAAVEDTIRKLDETGRQLVENAKNAAQQMQRTAEQLGENLLEDVQDFAEDLKENAKETAEKVTQQLIDKVDDIKEEIERTAEALKATAKDIKDKAEEVVQNIKDTAEDVVEKGKEIVEKGKEIAEDVKEKVEEIAEKAGDTVEKVVDEAKKLTSKAQLVAQVAAKEAELALQKAEDAAKAVMLEVDRHAKELAIKAEAKAREAAHVAQKAAKIALEKARYAAQNLDELLKAAAKGATEFVLKAAGKIRQFAKQAIQGARIATSKAAWGARQAAKVFQSAKKEIVRGYEVFMMVSEKLGIERKQKDTFCSEAKKTYCIQIVRAQFHFIFVFIAAIVVNLSMVHFLMAMAANYVHVKRELKTSALKQQLEEMEARPAAAAEETTNLVYQVSDTGSLMALSEA